MPAFAEFVLVAVLLFLWESTLWLPLRTVALRGRRGGKWSVLRPDAWFATRELGLIPMLPFVSDSQLAPCQTPPLFVDDQGGCLIEISPGVFSRIVVMGWDDIGAEPHHLRIGSRKLRISSPRMVEFLRRAKARGATLETATRQWWRLSLSPGRARREWRRWKLVSPPLRWYGQTLTIGFFAGLPLAYVYLGGWSVVFLALWLWCLMAWTAAHLWWLGKRVYPDARAALRMDSLLCLVVPFHAMRALEIASVHAMGTTHPAAMILSTGDLENPWLGRFFRRILHPAPGNEIEATVFSSIRHWLTPSLARLGMSLDDFDRAPDMANDPLASSYCPRCHALYQSHVMSCPDCKGVELRRVA